MPHTIISLHCRATWQSSRPTSLSIASNSPPEAPPPLRTRVLPLPQTLKPNNSQRQTHPRLRRSSALPLHRWAPSTLCPSLRLRVSDVKRVCVLLCYSPPLSLPPSLPLFIMHARSDSWSAQTCPQHPTQVPISPQSPQNWLSPTVPGIQQALPHPKPRTRIGYQARRHSMINLQATQQSRQVRQEIMRKERMS